MSVGWYATDDLPIRACYLIYSGLAPSLPASDGHSFQRNTMRPLAALVSFCNSRIWYSRLCFEYGLSSGVRLFCLKWTNVTAFLQSSASVGRMNFLLRTYDVES